MPSPIVTDNNEFGSVTAHNDDKVDSEAVMPLGPELPIGDDGQALTANNMEQLLRQQEMEAADTDGLEVLRNVFDSMATEGKITMDQLPFVLVGAEVQATAKEIDEAIEEYIPDSDETEALLDFEQVLCLYQQLAHNSADMAPMNNPQDGGQAKVSLWRRLLLWYKQYRLKQTAKEQRTAYERHMKPTTRLLLMILACASFMCIAVVVLAIAYIWVDASNVMTAHLQRTAQLLSDGMYLFGYTLPFNNYDSNLQQEAMLLGVVAQQLGYMDTMNILKQTMVYEQNLLISFLDSWFSQDSMNTVATNAMLSAGFLNNFYQRRGQTAAVQMVNRINPLLPAGQEILVGRWDPVAQNITLLCTPRYADQCANGKCIIANAAMVNAVKGLTGQMFTTDYRPHPVVAGYTYLNASDLGLVYKVDLEVFQADFQEPMATIIDQINAKSALTLQSGSNLSATQEVVLATQVDGETQILSTLRNCDAKCLQSADVQGNVITLAFEGVTGVNETVDFDGREVIEAYGPFQYAGLALAIKTDQQEFLSGVYIGLGQALNAVNDALTGTLEVQFATVVTTQANATSAGTQVLSYYTVSRFSSQCDGPCGGNLSSSEFMRLAAFDCESGAMQGTDYRDVQVVAGYACVPSLSAGLVMKVDVAQVISEGVAMVGTIATYENDVRYAASTTEVEVAKKKPGVTVVTSVLQENVVTKERFANQCPNSTCTGSDLLMQLALAGQTGALEGPDYRNVPTLGAYTFLPGLEVGIVVKMDVNEANSNTVTMAMQLSACAIAAVLISMAVLALLANVLLKTMDRTWDEGKKAIEREKEQLCGVITAMYPPQVAKRMIAGETHIVYNVGCATVFFSDIYEFTTASNTITPEQLIQFLGYTFGLMDAVADHFRVHKIKTIGDAYLAVSGLPGTESVHGNSTLDMMLFASCCVQLFGQRFVHPDEGAIMGTVTRNLFAKKQQQVKRLEAAAAAPATGHPVPTTSVAASLGAEAAGDPSSAAFVPNTHCTMRYGLSAGPITAGVLQGKTPLFDIWGRTVNLASRMESTGQPGRIQVAEGVYQTIVALKDQPFTFEARHKVFCKGFGKVSAYFVNTCSVAPPKELLTALHIEPGFGNFYFDNPVPGFKAAARGSVVTSQSNQHTSSHGSTKDHESTKSSEVSGRHIRAEATL